MNLVSWLQLVKLMLLDKVLFSSPAFPDDNDRKLNF